ncbi:MAG TPA: hypothetical protein VFN67_25130 [Polyangiales bacterium]|nr:hypothetical protein [Polyangiales bacterium]
MQYRTAASGLLAVCLMLCGLFGCDTNTALMPRPPSVYANKDVSYFAFERADNPQLQAAAVGEITDLEIRVDVPFDTDVTALVPRIEHAGVSIEPESGAVQDFSEPVDYVVTAEDGSEGRYTVTVNVLSMLMQPEPRDGGRALDATKEITRFSIAGIDAAISADDIDLVVPHDTRLRGITPELEFRGAAISPRAIDPQDFSHPVVYTVTAQDGSTRSYTVRVEVLPNTSKDITHFRVFGIDSTIIGSTIVLTLPAGSDLSMLEPTITLSGGAVMPPSGELQDFTQPVDYVVTGADGSTQTYTVIVMLASGSANDIISFEVPSALTVFNGDEITLYAAYGVDNCNWTPTIMHSGVSIEPPRGQVEDFQAGVEYTVSAGDGSKRKYKAICRIATTSATGITSFEVQGLAATIIGDDITLTVPNSTSLGSLTPTIQHHGVRITPPSGAAQNFYAPVQYKLQELSGEERVYNVRIVNADRSDNELIELSYAGRTAQIIGQKVQLSVPAGTDLHALQPSIWHRGSRVSPTGVALDFSMPQTYGVIAKDGTRRDYEVTVRTVSPDDKTLERFALGPIAAAISGTQVTLLLPAGSDPRALTPKLQHTGASISPSPEEPRDFTKPVNYLVTAADGSTRSYTVTATIAAPNAAALSNFRLLGQDAVIGTTQIELSVPAGTNLAALVPAVQITGKKLEPSSSIPQDFTNPVTYKVTAADGSTKNYKVTVTQLLL